jgi:phage tail-like protein
MDAFSNLNYLYEHLPSRYRRADADLFLKRFLSWFGGELDGIDNQLDSFYLKIKPETAPEEFIEWWLYALFGWSWFPSWVTLAQKRAFYGDIAAHYARRGTARGIEEFLLAFGVSAKVHNRPIFWGEFVWGEDDWAISDALGFVVEIFPTTNAVPADETFWGELIFGESHFATPGESLQRVDVEELLRFQQPASQEIIIDYRTAPPRK